MEDLEYYFGSIELFEFKEQEDILIYASNFEEYKMYAYSIT